MAPGSRGAAESLLAGRGFSLRALIDAAGFEKLALLQTAANAVSATEEEKKAFQARASELARLMKYVNREDIAADARRRYEAVAAIDGLLRKKRRTAGNVDLMVEINRIISEYVQIERAAEGAPPRRFDISRIDFDLLSREFARAKEQNLILKDLRDVLHERLDRMLFRNPGRLQYHQRYQAIIEDYNRRQDSAGIEKTFDELVELVQSHRPRGAALRAGGVFQRRGAVPLRHTVLRGPLPAGYPADQGAGGGPPAKGEGQDSGA